MSVHRPEIAQAYSATSPRHRPIDRPWEDLAACRGKTSVMFPAGGQGSGANWAPARAICAQCPVRNECLDDAIATRDVFHGMRGGMEPEERYRLMRRIQRQRAKGRAA